MNYYISERTPETTKQDFLATRLSGSPPREEVPSLCAPRDADKPELTAKRTRDETPRNRRYMSAPRLVRNDGHLIRQLLRLADLLETRRLARSLERELEVSRSTVYRYLECLKNLGVGVKKEQVNGCVFYQLPQANKRLLTVQLARVLLEHIDRRLLQALNSLPEVSGRLSSSWSV